MVQRNRVPAKKVSTDMNPVSSLLGSWLYCGSTVTVKARPRPRIRHGSAQDPLIDSRIYGAARRRS